LMSEDMIGVGNQLCDYLDTFSGKEVKLLPILKGATFDVIGLAGFGHDFGSIKALAEGRPPPPAFAAFSFLQNDVFERQFKRFVLSPTSLLYWLPTENNLRHAKEHKILTEIIDSLISKFQSGKVSTEEREHENFLKYMINAKDEATGEGMSRQALIDNTRTLLFGGFDTSSLTLAFTAHLLSQHPDVQRKLHLEVDAYIPTDHTPTYSDFKNLPFTTACVKESLRLFPPLPLTARTLTEDMKIDGEILPAGSMVWIPIVTVHRFKGNYPEPDVFKPERWDPEAKPAVPMSAWIPFSYGLRMCLGYKMAMLEATLLLAMLARRFEFIPAKGYEMKSSFAGLVQEPSEGLRIIVRSRV